MWSVARSRDAHFLSRISQNPIDYFHVNMVLYSRDKETHETAFGVETKEEAA